MIAKNDDKAWYHLLSYPSTFLTVPTRCGHRWDLTTIVNRRLRGETSSEDPSIPPKVYPKRRHNSTDPLTNLGFRISAKLEEGDLRETCV